MLREYKLQTWFWWTTIAACGFSFLLAVGSGTAPAMAHATASESTTRVSVHGAAVSGSPSQALSVQRIRARVAAGAPAAAEPAEARTTTEPATRGLRRLKTNEVSPEMLAIAQRMIREHHHDRPGTEVPFDVGSESYVARIERHYHPEGGPVKPWGYHPGVSLLKAR